MKKQTLKHIECTYIIINNQLILCEYNENFIIISSLLDDDFYPCFNRLSLWSFIYDLLEDQRTPCVKWTNREKLEFKVEDTEALAQEWGQRKGKNTMTWAKFARAMRYYYGKDVLEKVERKRFTYKFIDSPKTRSVIRSRRRFMEPHLAPSSPVSSITSSTTDVNSIISDKDYSNLSKSIDILNPPAPLTPPSSFRIPSTSTTTLVTKLPTTTTYDQVQIESIKKELEISFTQCGADNFTNSSNSLYTTTSCYNSMNQQQQQPFAFQLQQYQQQQQNFQQQQQQQTSYTFPCVTTSATTATSDPMYSYLNESTHSSSPNNSFDEYFSEEDFSPRPNVTSYNNQFIVQQQQTISTTNSLTACEQAILASLVDSFHNEQ